MSATGLRALEREQRDAESCFGAPAATIRRGGGMRSCSHPGSANASVLLIRGEPSRIGNGIVWPALSLERSGRLAHDGIQFLQLMRSSV